MVSWFLTHLTMQKKIDTDQSESNFHFENSKYYYKDGLFQLCHDLGQAERDIIYPKYLLRSFFCFCQPELNSNSLQMQANCKQTHTDFSKRFSQRAEKIQIRLRPFVPYK